MNAREATHAAARPVARARASHVRPLTRRLSWHFFVLSAFSLLVSPSSFAQRADDGEIVSREPCSPSGSSYAEYVSRQQGQWEEDHRAALAHGLALRPLEDFRKAALTEAEYQDRKRYADLRCERIVYRSGGLRVVAFFWRPEATAPESGRLPLIYFNRGGYGETFKLRPNTWFGFYNYLQAGYAVLGSQYRGNDGGEGRDELGGADLEDVLNLAPLARRLGFPPTTPTYALGFSRGGLMTMLALSRGLKVRAAALIGSPATLEAPGGDAAALDAFAARIPGFREAPEAVLQARSPLRHLDGVETPLLVLHGTADAMVPASDSIRLAEALLQRHAPVELVLYDGDSHGLALNGRERDRHVLAWFSSH
jgi:dipeptidyl aminopeptidase/acylaminoacyl peptidase